MEARHRLGGLVPDAVLLIKNKWATHDDADIRAAWESAMKELSGQQYRIIPVPMEAECLTLVDNPRKGANMFALGLLAWVYQRDIEKVKEQIGTAFRKKRSAVFDSNVALLKLGYEWAEANIDFRIDVPPASIGEKLAVMNGNEALGLGAIASGMELCAMYPITPKRPRASTAARRHVPAFRVSCRRRNVCIACRPRHQVDRSSTQVRWQFQSSPSANWQTARPRAC